MRVKKRSMGFVTSSYLAPFYLSLLSADKGRLHREKDDSKRGKMVKTRRMLLLREMGGMSPKKITAKNCMLLPIHFFYAVKSSEFKFKGSDLRFEP